MTFARMWSCPRLALALAAGTASSVAARPADAWYFPEHVEMSRLALQDFAPGFVTRTIEAAVADARVAGLPLCPGVLTALHAVPTAGDAATCIPYGALTALAGDHANDWMELRRSLAVPVYRPWPMGNQTSAALITATAKDTWLDFQARMPPEVIRAWTSEVSRVDGRALQLPYTLAPRDLVRELDVKLWAVDPDYISRAGDVKAHFHDPTSSVEATLMQAAGGGLDNALGQALAHHARSLQLALRSRAEPDASVRVALRTEALLEHAFAVHFLEDGFASGHIATDPAVAEERRTQRHDYFNRQGLAVTRALGRRRCVFQKPRPDRRSMGLKFCWVAHGDGFTGPEDRLHAGEAVARAQTEFAVALEPKTDAWYAEQGKLGECHWEDVRPPAEGCDLGWAAALLDPRPAWAIREPRFGSTPVPPDSCPLHCSPPADSSDQPPELAWARCVVQGFERTVRELGSTRMLVPANSGTPQAQPGALTAQVLGQPLAGLERDSACDWHETVWLPILVAWPEAQADVATLDGTDTFDRGFKGQALVSAAASYVDPFAHEATLTAWGGVGIGVAYTAQGVFPRRRAFELVEVNSGVAQGILLAGDSRRFPSVWVVELRSPVTTLLLYGASKLWHTAGPLDLVGDSFTIGLFGARAYFSLDREQPVLSGWDAEVVDILLWPAVKPRPAAAAGILDGQVRGRIGVRSSDPAARLPSMFGGAVMLTIETTCGYFTRF